MQILILVASIIFLGISANFVINAVQKIAEYFKISPLFIGLTVISVGTSLPEIAVSVTSGINKLNGIDASGIAVGNTIGSAINLMTFILGIIAILIAVKLNKRSIKRDGLMLLISVILLFMVSLDFKITQIEAGILIVAYGIYLFSLRHEVYLYQETKGRKKQINIFKNLFWLIGGITLLIFSAEAVVGSALEISKQFGIEETLVGLLIIGLGTGLPELAVSIGAILKKSYGLAAGNLIGSNICDLLFSLGIGGVFAGFNVAPELLRFDIPFLLFVFLFLLLLLRKKGKIDRKRGVALICLYVVYVSIKLISGL